MKQARVNLGNCKRSRQRDWLSLSLVGIALGGWLCSPNRFPVSPGPSASAATAMVFTVTSAGDAGVLCVPSEPTCTLRQAINAANSNPGQDSIRFQIGGSTPVKTIVLQSALPQINDPVVIDGTTQPGYAGQPLIELNGANAGPNANGLTISHATVTPGGTTVKGLIINRFGGDGINVDHGTEHRIQGNYIGTDATGNVDLGNGLNGVRLRSANNVIGGGNVATRNVISGNGAAGVVINGAMATGNQLLGNYIGTNATGAASLANEDGVFISGGAANNSVSVNVVSGNTSNGIEIRDINSTGNTVQANLIGTDSSGNNSIPNNAGVVVFSAPGALIGGNSTSLGNVISGNASFGVFLTSSSPATTNRVQNNFVGSTRNGASLGNNSCGIALTGDNGTITDNTIAFNHNDGICVLSGTGNLILANRIFSNSRLGIDLGPDGVTANDAGDPDAGANDLQNFPILTAAVNSGSNLSVRGTLNSTPNSQFSIFVFANDECDPSGYGEGESSFGSILGISTDASGNVAFSVQGVPPPSGRFLTAVAVKLVGGVGHETSEFSPCRQMTSTGTLRLSAANYSVNEASGSIPIVINRVNGSDGSTYGYLSTANGTAIAGQDYTNASTLVNFAAGQTSQTIMVPITNDATPELAETINLYLSQPTGGAEISEPSAAVVTIDDNDSGAMIHLSATSYEGNESCAPATVTVTRSGDLSVMSTVDYSTTSGTASDQMDFTAATGRLRFDPGETQKSFVILISEDSHTEGTETASITLSNPIGTALGSPSIASLTILDDPSEPATNAIDDSGRFVCQHYHDFLNRQADTAGQQFWVNEIESCGTDANCREVKRINVSAAFFLSIEFQQTGYLVYRLYKVAYGNMPTAPVPVTLQEFLPDTQTIGRGVQVGIGDWQIQLENNKNAFTSEFAGRPRFANAFPAFMTPAQFVDALNANSGGALTPAERNQLVNDLAGGVKTRAQVLRAVAEDPTLVQSESNKAFVLMQYFGYLRRNPNSIPDSDFSGYNFWLQKLNQFNGNFVEAEMVKSFLVAAEYRHRFGS